MPVNHANDDTFLGPDDEPPNRPAKQNDSKVVPLRRSPNLFVRVPLQWLTHPVQGVIFPPELRLLLYLQLRSHEGQRGVVVTDKFAAEVGVTSGTKREIIRRLKRQKLLRVERSSRFRAPIVWPILLKG